VELLGADRHVVVAREVTKLHEEFLRGRAEDVLATLQKRGETKGEITLLLGKAENGEQVQTTKTVGQRVRELMGVESLDEKAALKQAAKEFGVSKSEAYRELQRVK
jgi:16S rRNA (cytidine1402-2'-O)-methyltransferase